MRNPLAGGIPIVVSREVPWEEIGFEASYRRPLLARLVRGRTIDLNVNEEPQSFLMRDPFSGYEYLVVHPRTERKLARNG